MRTTALLIIAALMVIGFCMATGWEAREVWDDHQSAYHQGASQ